jgi:hypothetical protein
VLALFFDRVQTSEMMIERYNRKLWMKR